MTDTDRTLAEITERAEGYEEARRWAGLFDVPGREEALQTIADRRILLDMLAAATARAEEAERQVADAISALHEMVCDHTVSFAEPPHLCHGCMAKDALRRLLAPKASEPEVPE
jgi:hypothetical protein